MLLDVQSAACSMYVHLQYQASEPMRRRWCTRGRQRRALAVGDEN
jgi:hypothetical protein